jgi:hypothetical protein
MRAFLVLVASLPFWICAELAFAAKPPIQAIDSRNVVIMHDRTECKKNDTCDLLKMDFRVRQYRIPPEDVDDSEFLGTVLYASYETDRVETLPKYAFVQFIRGCVYRSWKENGGTVATHFSVARRYMDVPNNKFITFCHRDWMIDANQSDPIYSSEPSESPNRHYFLQWSDIPGKWDSNASDGHLFGEEVPKYPRGYVTDYPMQAYNLRGVANNVSLEFRMCLYKTADVPPVLEGKDVNFAKPIYCFDWSHNFVYNHDKDVFERPSVISPVCARPFTPEETERDLYIRGVKQPQE